MREVISITLDIFQNYGGSSMMTLLVMAAMLYLWIAEEKADVKILFVYVCAAVTALFFFPPFAYVVIHYFLDGQVYYRLLWLIPMGTIVSYGLVRLLSGIETKRKRVVIGVVCALFIMQSGSLIYQNDMVTRAENLYHLPQSVLHVADVLHVEGTNVRAVVPSEMLQFIRQYDASIELAYGREVLVEGWSNNPLYDTMEENPIHSFALTDYSKQQGLDYIVIRTGTPVVGSKPIEKYQFTYLATVDNYDIYIYDKAEFAQEKLAEMKGDSNEEAG